MKPSPELNYKIRECRLEDIEEVSNIICRCLREVNSADYPESTIELMLEEFSPSNLPQWFSKMDRVVVITDGVELLGTGSLEGNRIKTVFVSPDVHGKGLGSKIMANLEDQVRSNGDGKVVLKSSLSSVGFYKGRGYKEVNRVYQDRGGEMVVMEKVL